MAEPMANTTGKTVAYTFAKEWTSNFSVQLHVITDRGQQIEGEIFQELSRLLGFHRLRTSLGQP